MKIDAKKIAKNIVKLNPKERIPFLMANDKSPKFEKYSTEGCYGYSKRQDKAPLTFYEYNSFEFDIEFDEEALSMLSETSRGNARSCVLRAKEVKLYADRYEITRFTKEDAEKLFFILDILPHGLNRIEWQILNILRKEGNCTLSMLAAKTGLSRTAIQRDHELYLIRKGFISIDNVRYITGNGCKVLESVKK